MLLYLLGYLLVGVLAILTVSMSFAITVIRRKYDLHIMTEICCEYAEGITLLDIVIGLFIWPVRIMQYTKKTDQLYEAYNQYRGV